MEFVSKLAIITTISVMGVFPSPLSLAQVSTIEVKAENSLEKMLNYLNSKSSLKFQADITQDLVITNGQKIQLGATAQVKARRPNKFIIDYQGDRRHVRFYYDGKTFTMNGLTNKVYANFPVPADMENINDVINEIGDKLNITLPLGEIISTDENLASINNRITSAIYIGESTVNEVPCHHLAFTQDNLDWQIWIEKGDQPVPRKLVITYKKDTSSPQYTALLSNWNFDAISAQDSAFLFKPEDDFTKIDFVIVEE